MDTTLDKGGNRVNESLVYYSRNMKFSKCTILSRVNLLA